MQFTKSWVAAAAMVALTGAAQAALVNLNNGTVKDTNTNLIWRQDWAAYGSDYWSVQKAKVETDVFAGSSNWEMSSSAQMTALLSSLSNDTFELSKVFAFRNTTAGFFWMSTERAANPVGDAEYYELASAASLSWYYKDQGRFAAVAVRFDDGSTAAPDSPVPEPQTLALTLLALAATVVARRRRAA